MLISSYIKMSHLQTMYKSLVSALQINRSISASISSGLWHRNYESAAAATHPDVCWNCKKFSEGRNHMICGECGHLLDVNKKINYFELLSFPVGFGLQSTELRRRFRQMQTLVHPDKFSNKSEREQSNSAEWSSLINKAYKTLATPIERGKYLLQVNGHTLPQDNSALDKEFLIEMMERNEEVEATNQIKDLIQLQNSVVDILQQNANKLSKKFDANAFDDATAILVKMKYLQSLLNSIKQKLENNAIN